MTPEQIARQEIDKQLETAGWVLQDYPDFHITAGLGAAVREFPLTPGKVGHLLCVDAQVIGVIEAKPENHTLTGKERGTIQREKDTKLPSRRRKR